jgi:hypothetical protein
MSRVHDKLLNGLTEKEDECQGHLRTIEGITVGRTGTRRRLDIEGTFGGKFALRWMRSTVAEIRAPRMMLLGNKLSAAGGCGLLKFNFHFRFRCLTMA